MGKAAATVAAVVSLSSVFAPELQGAPLGDARPVSEAARQKPCPPFLAGDQGSATSWCRPRADAAPRPGDQRPVPSQGLHVPALDVAPGFPEMPPGRGAGLRPHDVLLGITWDRSLLVSFDPERGEVLEEHARLDPARAFTALAFDPDRHRLYAMSQGDFVLTIVDTESLQIVDIVNLRVDPRAAGLTDTVALARDPATGTLYTIVGRWSDPPDGPIRSELAAIDPENGVLTIVGRIDGPWFASLAFSETDRRLYGTGVFGAGPWDSPFPTHVIRIDPHTAASETVLVAPYHTMLGLAVREPFSFFSWINWTTRFYGRIDLPTRTVTPMGPADGVDVVYAMLYKNFSLPPRTVHVPSEPKAFQFSGRVSDVWDPQGRLAGKVHAGLRFDGRFGYDAAAPVKFPDPNDSAPYGVSLTIGGLRYISRGLTASITNDRYDWTAESPTDSFGWTASADSGAILSWTLFDPTGDAVISATRLPKSFELSDWEHNTLTVEGYDACCPGPVYAFSGVVERASATAPRGLAALVPGRRPLGAAGARAGRTDGTGKRSGRVSG